MADVTEVTGTKRKEVSRRTFKGKDGSWTSRATPDTVGFKIELVEDGEVAHTIERDLVAFDESVRNAAAAFGFVTSITNTFGGIKGPIEELISAAEDRLAVFDEGDWTGERQGGPRTSHLLEAAIAVRADAGKETSDEWKAKFQAALKADENYAKELQKDPTFAAKLAAIKAKAAAERATKLADAAKEAGPSSLLD